MRVGTKKVLLQQDSGPCNSRDHLYWLGQNKISVLAIAKALTCVTLSLIRCTYNQPPHNRSICIWVACSRESAIQPDNSGKLCDSKKIGWLTLPFFGQSNVSPYQLICVYTNTRVTQLNMTIDPLFYPTCKSYGSLKPMQWQIDRLTKWIREPDWLSPSMPSTYL